MCNLPSGPWLDPYVVCSRSSVPLEILLTPARLPAEKRIVRSIPGNILAYGLCLLICCLSLGCLAVPMRAPTRVNGASGAGPGKADLNFIQAGTTGRDEVTQRLGWTDTGIKEERLFLGRWASSSWGVAWAAGGGYSGAAGWNRDWKAHNILIEFDKKDLVEQFHAFGDGELVEQLSTWAAKGQYSALDLSTPIEIPIQHRHTSGGYYGGVVVLAKDSFRLHELDNTSHDFQIPPAQINKLSLSSLLQSDRADPHALNLTLHFAEKTQIGNQMTLLVNVPAIVMLVKYLAPPRPD